MRYIETDVVVAGGGSAGLAAAATAASSPGHMSGFAFNSGRIAGENAVKFLK